MTSPVGLADGSRTAPSASRWVLRSQGRHRHLPWSCTSCLSCLRQRGRTRRDRRHLCFCGLFTWPPAPRHAAFAGASPSTGVRQRRKC